MKLKELILDAGGVTRVAQICNVHRTAIYRWLNQGWIRTTHLERIAKATGLHVERYMD
jgi:DNA-binding phage protein